MGVSIIIPFCDKDFCYIKDILSKIDTNVKIQHEVILLDNRENKNYKVEGKFDKIVINEHNGYNYSRKKAVPEATMEYIWFIDADDTIYEIDETFNDILNKNYDSIDFLFTDDLNKFCFYKDKKIVDFFTDTILWNRWIKTNCCLKAFKDLSDCKLCFSDDVILCYALGNVCKNNFKSDKKIYHYHNNRSLIHNNKKISDKAIDEMFIGIGHYKEELRKINHEGNTSTLVEDMISMAEKSENQKRTLNIIIQEFNEKKDLKILYTHLVKAGFTIDEIMEKFKI